MKHKKKKKRYISELRDNFKWLNKHSMGVPKTKKREEKWGGKKKKNWRNSGQKSSEFFETSKRTDPSSQTPSIRNVKISTPGHIIIKLLNTRDKRRLLKAVRRRKKKRHVKRNKIRTANFSAETIQVRQQWSNISKTRGKNSNLEFYTQQKYLSKTKAQKFSDIWKLKEFITQQTCTTKNDNISPSGRRKMVPDRNMDLHPGMKSTRNANNHMGTCIRVFSYYLYLFKR